MNIHRDLLETWIRNWNSCICEQFFLWIELDQFFFFLSSVGVCVNCAIFLCVWNYFLNKFRELCYRIKQLQWIMVAISAKDQPPEVIWEWVHLAWVLAHRRSHTLGLFHHRICVECRTESKCQINTCNPNNSNLGTCFIHFNLFHHPLLLFALSISYMENSI